METSTPVSQSAPSPEISQENNSAPDANLETSQENGQGEALNSEAKAPAPKVEEKKPNKRKLKLKVDGKESEEEINLDDDEYLTKQIQLARAAQKRMSEYSQLEKEVRSFMDMLKKDPRKVLSDPNIGIDVKQFAAQILEEEIANSQKSPEQLEREKLEGELRSIKEEREREKEEFKKKEFERLQTQAIENYDRQITDALGKSDLPKSPYIVKKIADYMLMGINEGVNVTAQDVLPLVREEMHNDLKEMFALMPDEVVEALVGKETIGRIRKKSLAKAKEAPVSMKSSIKDVGKTKEENKEVAKKMTIKDFFGV